MHDLHALRTDPDAFTAGLRAKGDPTDLAVILDHDRRHRNLLREIESLRNRRNDLSKQIAQRGVNAAEAPALRDESAQLGRHLAELEEEHRRVNHQLHDMLVAIPNVPDPSVPTGAGPHLVRVGREPLDLPFPPKPHWELAEQLDLVDMPRGGKVAGPSFPVLHGLGARLERALVQFMLDLHVRDHGALEVSVPYLVNRTSMEGTGQLPKLEHEMYRLERDDLFLIPTAEVPITNLFRDEVLDLDDLPLHLVGASPCFRREAGAAGRETRGLVRVHQFQKVELVHFVEPPPLPPLGKGGSKSSPPLTKGGPGGVARNIPPTEPAPDHPTIPHPLHEITAQAEAVLRRLELPYRIVEVPAEDLSFSSAKTYDLEVYAPGSQRWLEVSSASWFADFQARRCNIRYRDLRGKLRHVHTLNASGLAVPRTLVALLENHQQPDGTVRLPEPLDPYMGGIDVIRPSKH